MITVTRRCGNKKMYAPNTPEIAPDAPSDGDDVVAGDNFAWDSRKAVRELSVLAHPLKKHKPQDVRNDDANIHDRQHSAVRVVVADGHVHGRAPSKPVNTGRFRTIKDNW